MALVKYNNNSISDITTAGQVATGSLVPIKTLTASSSATLSFVHGTDGVVLDSTYPIYQFIFINPSIRSNTEKLAFNVSIDGGSNYNVAKTSTAFRAYHGENDSGGVLQYYGDDDLAQGTGLQPIHHGGNTDADSCVSGDMFLFNPSSTTFVKHFIIKSVLNNSSTNSQVEYMAGYANTTSAINAVRFQANTGNIDGTIKLYGIKDS
jgi:hypothetical protein